MDSFPIVLPVRFVGGGLTMHTTTSRMSAEGVFVRCLVSPKEGSQVVIHVTLPDKGAPAEVAGSVGDRVLPGTAGKEAGFWVTFGAMHGGARERVNAFLVTKGQRLASPPPAVPPASPGVEPAGSRRTFPRVATRLQVGWSSAKEFLVAYSENLSKGGIFVSTAHPPPVHETVELLLELPDGEGPARTQAVVVQRTTAEDAQASGRPAGAGLQFTGGDEDFRRRLDRCIDNLLLASPD